ncbi:MAG: PDZ domain-containing protein [Planctomycetes bacterium]|nr:PDZ domain-containing protein [Planctomycetota bacterium]
MLSSRKSSSPAAVARSRGRGSFFGKGRLVLAICGVSLAAGQQIGELSSADLEKAERLRQDLRQMVSLARDQVFPALVNIRVITVSYWNGKEDKGQATGSGTIISPEGYVLTNFHVAENGKRFKCTLSDKQEISATLVGEDPLTDLAVLKLDLGELKDKGTVLPFAHFGDSDRLEIGDPVMAMGSPFSLSRSVTYGIVSNTERMLTAGDDEAGELMFDEHQRTGLFNRWIQHDASINPGNSGGPLVNLRGEVVGVNTRGGENISFAVPGNVAKRVAESLISKGEVPRSWYGLAFKSIKKTGLSEGVFVNTVIDDSPAAKGGLQAGDVIVKIDGQPITVRFPEEIPELSRRLADRPIGSDVHFTVSRDGQAKELTIKTAKLEKDRGDEAAFRAWGITGQSITERMAHVRRLDRPDGVLVTSVRNGSSAAQAEPPISEGDVIRKIDGKPIPNLDAFIETYRQVMAAEKPPEYLLIEYETNAKNQITLIKPKPDKDDDPPREVPKAWVAVETQAVLPKLARQLGEPDQLGFRVTLVYPNTGAAKAGLQVGDLIVALDGEPLRPQRNEDSGLFQRMVRKNEIDAEAALTIVRGGARSDVKLKLERTRIRPEEARKDVNRDFELTVRELTFFDRHENRWSENTQGVIVIGAERASWAALAGLTPGDLIQKINAHTITDLKSYRDAMDAIAKAEPARVVFVVLRGGDTHFQYAEPEWNPLSSKPSAASRPAGKE